MKEIRWLKGQIFTFYPLCLSFVPRSFQFLQFRIKGQVLAFYQFFLLFCEWASACPADGSIGIGIGTVTNSIPLTAGNDCQHFNQQHEKVRIFALITCVLCALKMLFCYAIVQFMFSHIAARGAQVCVCWNLSLIRFLEVKHLRDESTHLPQAVSYCPSNCMSRVFLSNLR